MLLASLNIPLIWNAHTAFNFVGQILGAGWCWRVRKKFTYPLQHTACRQHLLQAQSYNDQLLCHCCCLCLRLEPMSMVDWGTLFPISPILKQGKTKVKWNSFFKNFKILGLLHKLAGKYVYHPFISFLSNFN